MKRSFILLIISTTFCLSVEAQTRKERKKNSKGGAERQQTESPSPGGAPTSLNPNAPEPTQYGPKRAKKSNKRITYSLEEEYYQRVEAVAKQRQKTAKIMEKPQYSNPMYFGHKRMPKKRPAHKMRFCKECGIRH